MKHRKPLPVAALRAFEAAARHGRLTAAAEELSVTHGAVSRHVSHLEALLGTPLFEGPRNRPRLTAEGRVFGTALTAAFDQIDDAVRIIAKGDDTLLDVACLSTLAMRWLIPRLHDFTTRHPRYDVRLATDDRSPRTTVDARITILSPDSGLPDGCTPLFDEQLGMVLTPALAATVSATISKRPDGPALWDLPRLESRTRPQVWQEWFRLLEDSSHPAPFPARPTAPAATRMFDHLHMTLEAALTGLGMAVAPWHLVATDVTAGRLVAPLGFRPSGYRYVVRTDRPGRPKISHFIQWLQDQAATDSPPPVTAASASPAGSCP